MKTLKLFGVFATAAILSASAMASDYDFDVEGQISAVDNASHLDVLRMIMEFIKIKVLQVNVQH